MDTVILTFLLITVHAYVYNDALHILQSVNKGGVTMELFVCAVPIIRKLKDTYYSQIIPGKICQSL